MFDGGTMEESISDLTGTIERVRRLLHFQSAAI